MKHYFCAAFASFDLKNANIYLVDGFTATGAVNLTAGYSIGASVMAIDGVTDELENGQRFTVGADTTIYTITGHTENTSGVTTSINFSPPLVVAANNDTAIEFGGRRLEVKLGDGNASYNEQREVEYRLNRGLIDEVRLGNQVPVEVTLDFNWEYITGANNEPPTIEDALKRRGNAAHWLSSDADQCRPYAVDIVIEYDPDCADIPNNAEDIHLLDFRYESLDHNASEGTISCTGRCNITEPTAVRR